MIFHKKPFPIFYGYPIVFLFYASSVLIIPAISSLGPGCSFCRSIARYQFPLFRLTRKATRHFHSSYISLLLRLSIFNHFLISYLLSSLSLPDINLFPIIRPPPGEVVFSVANIEQFIYICKLSGRFFI